MAPDARPSPLPTTMVAPVVLGRRLARGATVFSTASSARTVRHYWRRRTKRAQAGRRASIKRQGFRSITTRTRTSRFIPVCRTKHRPTAPRSFVPRMTAAAISGRRLTAKRPSVYMPTRSPATKSLTQDIRKNANGIINERRGGTSRETRRTSSLPIPSLARSKRSCTCRIPTTVQL
jgi:hypothetical protein